MFINSISASRSDIISQCLLKYYLRYVERIPGFGSKNEDALNFGSYIHKIFELGFQEKDLKSLLKLAEQEKKTYKIPFRENDRTKKCLENFLIWNQQLGDTVSTEMSFNLPLDKENDINFVGVIDRIIKGREGGYLVIDYKTSKKEKKTKDLLDDKQLKGYAYAIHELYNVPYDKIWCAHYYPVTNNFVSVRFSKYQIFKWKKQEIDTVWRIRKKKKTEFPAQQNIFCDWCEYQQACPKFHDENTVCQRMDEQRELKKQLDAEKKAKEALEETRSNEVKSKP
jgi:RecB family exonuclease